MKLAPMLLSATFALVPIAAKAERAALLVGVSQYPALPGEKLQGATGDLTLMKGVCRGFGISRMTVLDEANARRASILGSLDGLLEQAKPGDEVLLYFSGRGGANLVDSALEPTLLTADSTPKNADGDLKMSEVEQWATKVTAHGAHPVIFVDACWSGDKTRAIEARPYNPTPRSFDRKLATPWRNELYKGPGLFVSATSLGGLAYEWKLREDQYAGAFTTLFAENLANAALRSESLLSQSLVTSLKQSASQLTRQNYMPGFAPYATGDLTTPFLGGGFMLTNEGEVGALIARQKELAKQLRVQIEIDEQIDDSDQRGQMFRTINRGLRIFAQDKLDGVTVINPGDAKPDVIVKFNRANEGLTATVQDGSQRKVLGLAEPKGKTVEELLESGLSLRLQLCAYATKLYRLTACNKDTLPGTWSAELAKEYALGDEFLTSISGSTKARVYAFNVSDAVPTVTQLFPYLRMPEPMIEPGKALRLPPSGVKWQFRNKDEVGLNTMRFVWISADQALPKVDARDRDAFWRSMLPHLKQLCQLIESGTGKWAARSYVYDVRPTVGTGK